MRTRTFEPRALSPQQVEQDQPDVTSGGPVGRQVDSRGRRRRLPSVPRRWRDLPAGFRWSLLVYLLSRVPAVLGLLAYSWRHPKITPTATLLRQDGWWYVHLAQRGYSPSLRPPVAKLTDYHHSFSDWAFFPGYPMLIRAAHRAFFLPYLTAATVLAVVFGLLAVWAVYAMGAAFGGTAVAQASALLVAAWPGSAAFSLPYSEGLFVTAAALGLTLVLRERWLLAGLAGAVATATRPSGVAFVAGAGVLAVVHLVRRRDLRPMITPLLSVAGILAFFLYGWARTGDPMVWRHAENLWEQQLDFSRALVRKSLRVLADPITSLHHKGPDLVLANAVIDIAGGLVLLGMVVAAAVLWRRLTTAWVVYALVSTALIVAYSAVAPRPRTVLAILPGFVWLAAWLPRRVTYALAGIFLLAMPFVTYLWAWKVTP